MTRLKVGDRVFYKSRSGERKNTTGTILEISTSKPIMYLVCWENDGYKGWWYADSFVPAARRTGVLTVEKTVTTVEKADVKIVPGMILKHNWSFYVVSPENTLLHSQGIGTFTKSETFHETTVDEINFNNGEWEIVNV